FVLRRWDILLSDSGVGAPGRVDWNPRIAIRGLGIESARAVVGRIVRISSTMRDIYFIGRVRAWGLVLSAVVAAGGLGVGGCGKPVDDPKLPGAERASRFD